MWELEKELTERDVSENRNEMSKYSSFNTVSAFKSRFFNSSQESVEVKEIKREPEHEKKLFSKEKAWEKKTLSMTKDRKKHTFNANTKPTSQTIKFERDFRRFKAKYNTSVGNILRDWMSLIYCILVLRMNLIKLVLESFSKIESKDIHLQRQILFESKLIYSMTKNAQVYSQKKFYYMWTELEKLISDRKTLKDALQLIPMKDIGLRDWRMAAAKLAQMQKEFIKSQSAYEAIQLSKTEAECAIKENSAKLESACRSKEAEYKQLIKQITELKKREVQMRGKILLNMKSYKDLKTKRQNLLNTVNELNKLKNDQSELVKTYSAKIQMLKNEIEEKEKQIIMEKEEKRKIKISIENFGDFSRKSFISLKEI